MEVKKYDKIILDSSRSIDDIVAGIKAELSKKESENSGESYICYVSHAYSSGENAGVSYIVVSDGFKELKRLSSNVIKASSYSKDEINELIANTKDEIKGNLDSKSSEINSRINNVNSELGNRINEVNSTLTASINTKANQATTYTKTQVDTIVSTKANSNAVVALSGNQTIAGVKTFSALPVCNIVPTADNQVANRNYVKKRGGFVAITGGAIDLNRGINFSLNLTAATNITVANAAANIGQTGEIYVANGANIRAFSAPFNFRVAQSGFGANEVFSYLVVSANLVRITRS